MSNELPKYQPTITNLLKPLGFKKDGNYWWREFDTHFLSLNLDSSTYGFGEKHIIIRVLIKQLADPKRNFKNNWQATASIYDREMLNGALLTSHEFKDLPAEERLRRLEVALKEFALPLLNELDTLDGISRSWDKFSNFSVHVDARKLLGITGEKAVIIAQQKAASLEPKEDPRVKAMKTIMRASEPNASFKVEIDP